MWNQHGVREKRKFFRVNKKETCQYEKVTLSSNHVVTSRLLKVVSRNLSTSGIAFTTKNPPEVSSIVLIQLNHNKNQHMIEIQKRSFLYRGKVLGKVVRVEEIQGEYQVGIAFVKKDDQLAVDLEQLLKNINTIRITRILLSIAVILALIFSVILWKIAALQFKQTYQPQKSLVLSPASIGVSFEDVYFISGADGAQMNGWFVPAQEAQGTVLFCHGRSGNISGELNRINFFHRMGLNVFIFDYRGYGKSVGTPSEQGLFDDAKGAYDYLVQRKDIDPENIIVVGESLGGAVAADLAIHRKIKAVILESAFVSLRQQAKSLYPFLPVKYFMKEKYDTLEKIKKIHVPKLIVHGLEDELVPFQSAKILYQAAMRPKRIIAFKGGHSDGVYKVSDQYQQELDDFFQQYKIF